MIERRNDENGGKEKEKKESAKRGEKIENAAEQTFRGEKWQRIDLAHHK